MKTFTSNLALLLALLFIFGCTEEISEEIQNKEVLEEELTEIEKFQDKSIRVVHKMNEDLSYILHKNGNVDEACELDAPTLGFDAKDYNKTSSAYTVDCILDVQELDLYWNGADLELQVDQYLCEYITYEPFSFLQYKPGITSKVRYEVECDAVCAEKQPAFCNAVEKYDYLTLDTSVFSGNSLTGITATSTIAGGANPIFSSQTSIASTCDYDYSPTGPNCDSGDVVTYKYTIQGNEEDAVLGQKCMIGDLLDIDGDYRSTQVTCETSYTWNTGKCITATAVEAPNDANTCAAAGFFWIGDSIADDGDDVCYSGTEDTTITDGVSCGIAGGQWIGFCTSPGIGTPQACIDAGSIWNGPFCQGETDATSRSLCSGTYQDATCNSVEGNLLDVSSHTSQELCEAAGTWEFQSTCLDLTGSDSIDVVYDSLSESDCGGENGACLNGPAKDVVPGFTLGKTAILFENEDTDSFTYEANIASPFSKNLNSNMYVANFSRICSDTSNTKVDTDFDASLFLIDGAEVEEIAPFDTSFLSGLSAMDSDDNGGTDSFSYTDSFSTGYHPFNGAGYTSNPRYSTKPYYAFNCLDKALDKKAQIRIFIREWDRNFSETNVYLNRLSDINQATPLMDASGTQEVGSNWNDFADWDDLFSDVDFNAATDSDGDGDPLDKVFENNQCTSPAVGTCYFKGDDDNDGSDAFGETPNTTRAIAGIADQATCEAGGHIIGAGTGTYFWVSSNSVFPGSNL